MGKHFTVLEAMKSLSAQQLRTLAAKIIEPLEADRDRWRRTAEKLESEKQDAEAAVTLLVKRYKYKHHPESLESLCGDCESARERRCGPDFEGSEPCDTFRYFEKQAEEMAPLTRTLERMKA